MTNKWVLAILRLLTSQSLRNLRTSAFDREEPCSACMRWADFDRSCLGGACKPNMRSGVIIGRDGPSCSKGAVSSVEMTCGCSHLWEGA
jgi:hypothetical protein